MAKTKLFKKTISAILAAAMTMSLATFSVAEAAGNDLVIGEYTSADTVTTLESSFKGLSVSNENAREDGNSSYALFEADAIADQSATLVNDADISLADYNYINMWVYSPKANSAGIQLDVTDADANVTKLPTLLDFKGWKLIALDITALTGALNKLEIRINEKVDGTTYAGKYTGLFHQEGSFGIEKIWLSCEMPEEANKKPAKVVVPEIGKTATDYWVLDYNTQPVIDSTPSVRSQSVPNTQNNNLYGMNMRLLWEQSLKFDNAGNVYMYDKATDSWNVNDKYTATLTLFQAKTSEEKIQLNDNANAYFNMWVYNPQVSLNSNGSYAQLPIIFYTGKSVSGLEASGSENYKIAYVILNWTGWKLVSIRLGDLTSKNSTDTGYGTGKVAYRGIHKIEVSVNNAAGGPRVLTDGVSYTNGFTSKELERGWTGRFKCEGNQYDSAQGFGDGYNFIDIDRAWISNGKPVVETSNTDELIADAKALAEIDSAITVETENARNESYAKVSMKAREDKTFTVPVNKDLTGYEQLHMWVYSPKATTAGIKFYAKGSEDTLFKTEMLEWKGWKRLTYDISAIDENVTALEFVLNESVEGEEYLSKDVGMWFEDGFFGIENIYLSKNAYRDINVKPSVVESDVVKGAVNDDIWTLDYMNMNSIPTTLTRATAVADAQNTNLYDMNMRFGWTRAAKVGEDGQTYLYNSADEVPQWTQLKNTYSEATLFKAATSDEKIKFDSNNYDPYLNMWIYNPQVKLNSYGNYPQIGIKLYCGANGSSLVADMTKGYYKFVYVIADWSGWKLVSIPLTALTGTSSASTGHGTGLLNYRGINTIDISMSYSFGGNRTYTDGVEYINGYTQEELDRGFTGLMPGSNGVADVSMVNGWSDAFNFVDIDKVWISHGKPQEMTEITLDDTASIEAQGFNEENSMLILAEYDGNNLVQVKTANADEFGLIPEIKLDNAPASGSTVCAYMWDGTSFAPILDAPKAVTIE